MISLTEAFLAHGATAYPCGKVAESRKMLNELPAFKKVNWAEARLRTTLSKGVSTPRKRTVVRG